MIHEKLIDKFPSLASKTAILFRYDRQSKLWLLEIEAQSGNRAFLACYDCQLIEVSCNLPLYLDEILLDQEAESLVLNDPSRNFILKCDSIELWNGDKFSAYNNELYKSLGGEKGYGERKPITSINELR
jgi:hypothetical protein